MEKAKVLSLDETHLLKARPHKYIKRLGAPGKYQYVYNYKEAIKLPKGTAGYTDSKSSLSGKTFKMEAPFNVPVLPMSRSAKKFVITDIDRKLGIGGKPEKSEKLPEKGWLENTQAVRPWYMKQADKTFKMEGEEPKKMKTFGYDRIKLTNNYSIDELVKLDNQVKNNPENHNPAHLEGKSIYIYTLSARKKLDNIGWAITNKLKENKENKTFKMEGPRHIILEGGPNRRFTPEEKAAKFKQELESTEPTHLKPEVKKNINNMLSGPAYDGTSIVGYHEEIPLSDIFDILRNHGIVPLQEDNTEWSGFLLGREGQIYFNLAPFGSRSPEKEFEHSYKPFKNATLALSWYTMQSGRYEILSHVS